MAWVSPWRRGTARDVRNSRKQPTLTCRTRVGVLLVVFFMELAPFNSQRGHFVSILASSFQITRLLLPCGSVLLNHACSSIASSFGFAFHDPVYAASASLGRNITPTGQTEGEDKGRHNHFDGDDKHGKEEGNCPPLRV